MISENSSNEGLDMSLRLKNKIALVTGGGAGIGRAICLQFAANGAAVCVSDINLDSAREAVASIEVSGGRAFALEHDAASEQSWDEAVQQLMSRYGRFDVLVNNAGIVLPGTIEDTSLEDWKREEAVNVHGVFMGMQKAIAIMKENGGGSIVNISSIDGLVGDPKAVSYNAGKGSVRLMTKSAALHCASKKYNIRVNSVHPGYILTPLVEQVFAAADKQWMEEYQEMKISRIPLGQLGTPDDIAHGCVYLASDEAAYVTGAELVIDGGFTAT
jgi:NAD(P)-dependent dehydrogenase (short-subunit alcohol dehydrogenase family)